MIDWPNRLSLASVPTPIQLLSRWSKELGGPNIWIKRDDLTGSVLSGNKVRKLEFLLADAQAQGCNTLITCGGLQSNHCRATAFAGAQLGFKVHLVLRGETEDLDANLLMDFLAGAEVSMFAPRVYRQSLDQLLEQIAREYSAKGDKPYVIPTGASNGLGVWGYFSAAEELRKDCLKEEFKPDLIVTATGSGGTQAGLTLGADFFDLGCPVLGMAVCDDVNYFYHKVSADLSDFSEKYSHRFTKNLPDSYDIQTNDSYIGEGYAQASDEVLATISRLAAMEGVLLDPVYTGKAFYGLTQEIKKGRLSHLKNIIFIHTGGAWGIFPWRQRLSQITQGQSY